MADTTLTILEPLPSIHSPPHQSSDDAHCHQLTHLTAIDDPSTFFHDDNSLPGNDCSTDPAIDPLVEKAIQEVIAQDSPDGDDLSLAHHPINDFHRRLANYGSSASGQSLACFFDAIKSIGQQRLDNADPAANRLATDSPKTRQQRLFPMREWSSAQVSNFIGSIPGMPPAVLTLFNDIDGQALGTMLDEGETSLRRHLPSLGLGPCMKIAHFARRIADNDGYWSFSDFRR